MEHADAILSLIFSSTDPNWILSGSRDQSLHIWSIEQHTQAADQPIPINMLEEEEEISSNSGNKRRNHKPRPNRVEREKKRATKAEEEVNGNQNERMISSTSSVMNECKKCLWIGRIDASPFIFFVVNSLAFQLLWPSKTDREAISGMFSFS